MNQQLMSAPHRFPLKPEACPHPTSVWHPHRTYGDFEPEITCMGCGTPMVVPLAPDFTEKLQMFFRELDLRRQLTERKSRREPSEETHV